MTESTATHKLCLSCGNWLRRGTFSQRRDGYGDGLQTYCKNCANDKAVACKLKKKQEARRAKKRLLIPHGIVARYKGQPYTAVFVAPHGFTPEAIRQGVNR